MDPVTFCNRCRGLKVGWNRRYVLHSLGCQEWISRTSKLLVLTGLLSLFICAFPVPTAVVADSPESPSAGVSKTRRVDQEKALNTQVSRMLQGYVTDRKEQLPRLVRAIMASSQKYKVDPKLIASIVIVESGADPFAVSSAESVGIMQIHLPTWGRIADRENINLFKIEDNVDFGVRILRGYIRRGDVWGGVARYLGASDTRESQQAAQAYVRKVQRIYGLDPKDGSL
jgi:soluble lytic murein transglycosylase-like protein